MAAAGRKVSASNLRGPKTKPVRAVRQPRVPDPLRLPEVQSAVERLRDKYGANRRTPQQEGLAESLEVSRDQSRAERKLENAALRSLPTRGEALKAAPKVRAATQLNAEGTRVERLAGATQVGNEGLGAVQRAAERGQIRRRGNTFTTPRVRRVQRRVRRAKRQVGRARAAAQRSGRINIPGGEGVFINQLARETGLNPRVVAAWTKSEGGNSFGDYNLLNIGHTGSGPNSAAANGDFADPVSAAKATAAFLRGEWGGAGADIPRIVERARGQDPTTQIRVIEQSGWRIGTPGPDPMYSNLITSVFNEQPGVTKANPRAKRRLERAEARAEGVARQAANLGLSVQGLVTPEQIRAMGIQVERKPIRPTLWAQPKKAKGKGTVTWLNGTSSDGINPDIIALARTVSRMTGQDIQITSALRPTDYDSNHSEGGALDINAVADGGAGERAGDAIAYAAVIAAGGSREQAEALASGAAGIVQFTSPNGHSLEMLWKGDPGHRDHVHIAVESPGRGKKVFRGRKAVGRGALVGGFSSPSYMGGGTSGGGTSGGSSAPVSRDQRRKSVLALLRDLGYNVTSSGIRRTGAAASSLDDAPESVSKIKERYGVK